jgi:mono/diheme cytochrome c family protein
MQQLKSRQWKRSRLVLAGAVAWMGSITLILAQPVPDAAATQTVWSGIFSEAQAFRGEKVADTACIGCHGAGLEGGDSGPRLVGGNFLSAWQGKPVGELFDWTLKTMPENAPGTLKEEDVAAVVAYMFQRNDMPAGKQDMPAGREALAGITILATRP